jgi:hypothetical protein
MLFLNPKSLKIKSAKKMHLDSLIDLVYKRIDKLENLYTIRLFDSFIIDDLELILTGDPNKILSLSKRLNSQIGTNAILIKGINNVFNYDWFIDKCKNRYSGYDLANLLDTPTCTYCNRNYTTTVISKQGKKIIRPQFDHYFDKKRHPLLALSFFNLIPSCSTCNSNIKHGKEFTLDTHIHPYIDDVLDGFDFSYSYKSDPFYKKGLKIDINIQSDIFLKNFLQDLEIEEVYNSHSDILFDLIKTKQAYSDRYLSILENNILKGFKLSKKEIYSLVFGVHLEKENFEKRPFSKFKKDIITKLNII